MMCRIYQYFVLMMDFYVLSLGSRYVCIPYLICFMYVRILVEFAEPTLDPSLNVETCCSLLLQHFGTTY